MRKKPLPAPHPLLERLAEKLTKVVRLTGTRAGWPANEHIDFFGVIELAAAAGALDHDERGGTAPWKFFVRKGMRR